jgi:hypothetical protein
MQEITWKRIDLCHGIGSPIYAYESINIQVTYSDEFEDLTTPKYRIIKGESGWDCRIWDWSCAEGKNKYIMMGMNYGWSRLTDAKSACYDDLNRDEFYENILRG